MIPKLLSRFLFVAVIIGSLILAVVRQRTVSAQSSETFGGNIVLGRPTDRSITVNVLFTANQDAVYFEYGESPGALTKQTNPQQNSRAKVPYEFVKLLVLKLAHRFSLSSKQ